MEAIDNPKNEKGQRTKEPPRHRVVLHHGDAPLTKCTLFVLRDVFNMSAESALGIGRQAVNSRSANVLTGITADIAKTKAALANQALGVHKWHNYTLSSVWFESEPESP